MPTTHGPEFSSGTLSTLARAGGNSDVHQNFRVPYHGRSMVSSPGFLPAVAHRLSSCVQHAVAPVTPMQNGECTHKHKAKLKRKRKPSHKKQWK